VEGVSLSELRVPGVHGSPGQGVDLSASRCDAPARGAVVEVERPGSDLDGRSVIVYSVLAHPVDGRPGIAYARELPRSVSAQAFDTAPAGTGDSQRKGVHVSMQEQGGAQEPQSPDQPQEPMPEEPETMPDDPSPAPEAPDMPSDPDREPAQSPPEESASS